MSAITKIKCKLTDDDVLIITNNVTEIRCPHASSSGCKLTPKKRIMPNNPNNLTECHAFCLYEKSY